MDGMMIIHLLGGVRAVHGSAPSLVFDPAPQSNPSLAVSVQSLQDVFRYLTRSGLTIVGCKTFSHQLEVSGLIPAEWRTFHLHLSPRWLSFEARQKWAQISHAAHKQKIGKLWDLSGRVSYQIEQPR